MRGKLALIRPSGTFSPRGEGKITGFTLIEILVVLLIIGITFGFALLAFGDFGEERRMLTAGEQLTQYINVIQQQAILESNTFGIAFTRDGYDALRFKEPASWQRVPNQNLFRHHLFPNHLVFHFEEKMGNPAIIINASGDMNAFKLDLGTSRQPRIITIVGQANGDIDIKRVDLP